MMGANVRNASGLAKSGATPADAQAAVLAAIDYGSKGSYFDDLFKVLDTKYPKVKARKHDVSKELSAQLAQECSPAKPALCHIAWASGGHFTLCLGVVDDKLLFVDPYYGAVVMNKPADPTSSIVYDTSSNSTGQPAASGTICHAILTDPKPD